jgi:hydroxyacylglutathione hydrolase
MAEVGRFEGLEVVSFELGLAYTNAYLLGDPGAGEAIAVDPAWDGEFILSQAEQRRWRITSIWLTHAHFDHFGGAAAIAGSGDAALPIALHPADHPLWQADGGARLFGVAGFDRGPEPTVDFQHGMTMAFGGKSFEVRHTPGHSPGHVIIVGKDLGIVFAGDLVFHGSVGRADLPGGDWETLLASIRDEILVLPDATLLLSGHGPPTTVGDERRSNPFLTEFIR